LYANPIIAFESVIDEWDPRRFPYDPSSGIVADRPNRAHEDQNEEERQQRIHRAIINQVQRAELRDYTIASNNLREANEQDRIEDEYWRNHPSLVEERRRQAPRVGHLSRRAIEARAQQRADAIARRHRRGQLSSSVSHNNTNHSPSQASILHVLAIPRASHELAVREPDIPIRNSQLRVLEFESDPPPTSQNSEVSYNNTDHLPRQASSLHVPAMTRARPELAGRELDIPDTNRNFQTRAPNSESVPPVTSRNSETTYKSTSEELALNRDTVRSELDTHRHQASEEPESIQHISTLSLNADEQPSSPGPSPCFGGPPPNEGTSPMLSDHG